MSKLEGSKQSAGEILKLVNALKENNEKLEPANHVETILSKIKGGNQSAGEILKLVNALNDGKCRHINSLQEISFSIVPKQDNEQPDKEQVVV